MSQQNLCMMKRHTAIFMHLQKKMSFKIDNYCSIAKFQQTISEERERETERETERQRERERERDRERQRQRETEYKAALQMEGQTNGHIHFKSSK